MTVDASIPVPWTQRINIRMVLFAAVMLVLVGTPVYWYVDSALSGGIKNLGDRKAVSLKAMSDFAFDQVNGQVGDIPQRFRALDGQRIVVEGEIYSPNDASPRLQSFQVCYSIAKCCFNGPPQVQHFVDCTAAKDRVPYYPDIVRITGILHVKIIPKPEGGIASIYQMDVESVERAS